MLALKLGMSLVSTPKLGGWSPDDESRLEAWYQNAVGIALNGSDVRAWSDSSSNGRDMVQDTEAEQPAYSAGALTFDSATKENLQTTGQVTLTEQFVIGFIARPTATNVVILADNTTTNESVKYSTTSRIVIKIGGASKNLDLDSGTFGEDYIVISRDSSNVISLWVNGNLQSLPKTLAGSCLIDAIGVRAVDTNPFNGQVKEVQIYSTSNDTLIANVNARLASI